VLTGPDGMLTGPDGMMAGPDGVEIRGVYNISVEEQSKFLADVTAYKQGCHKGRFWMKMSVRTSFSSGRSRTLSGRSRASAFTPGRIAASVRAWTRVRADLARIRGCPASAWTRVPAGS
jgi:hypothetical protein